MDHNITEHASLPLISLQMLPTLTPFSFLPIFQFLRFLWPGVGPGAEQVSRCDPIAPLCSARPPTSELASLLLFIHLAQGSHCSLNHSQMPGWPRSSSHPSPISSRLPFDLPPCHHRLEQGCLLHCTAINNTMIHRSS